MSNPYRQASSIIDDLARILKFAAQTEQRQVVRLTVHPTDFERIASNAAFASAPAGPTQVACKGHLWGIAIHVDPRNEPNIAYVVTREGTAQRGTPYPIADFVDPYTRKTSWARVLEDDEP